MAKLFERKTEHMARVRTREGGREEEDEDEKEEEDYIEVHRSHACQEVCVIRNKVLSCANTTNLQDFMYVWEERRGQWRPSLQPHPPARGRERKSQ